MGVVQHSTSRADFLLKLQEKLGNGFELFDAFDSLEKSSQRLRVVGRAIIIIVMTHPSLSSGGIYWD